MATFNNSIEDTIIAGTEYNDTITNTAYTVTINAGKGDDVIYGSRHETIQYANGDGNDTYYNKHSFGGFIEITTGDVTNYKIVGKDHIIKIGNGSITFKDQRIEDNNAFSQVNFLVKSNGTLKRYINGMPFNEIPEYHEHFDDSTLISGTTENDHFLVYGDRITLNADKGNDFISALNSDNGSIINGDEGNDTINVGDHKNSLINGGNGNDFIHVEENYNNTVNAGEGNDTIRVFAKNESESLSIYADNGNDLIEIRSDIYDNSKHGKDITVIGGAGNDTFRNVFFNESEFLYFYDTDEDGIDDETVKGYFESPQEFIVETTWIINENKRTDKKSYVLFYERTFQYADGDGDDVIEDYHEGDTINITSGNISSVSLKGSNVILKIGSGSINLKGASGRTITIIDENGNTNTTVVGDGSESDDDDLEYVKLTNASISPYVAGSNVGTIDGSERTRAVKITGNDHDNVLIGGSKNDTFIGGSGNDTFVSNAGKDIVTDYAEGDVISIAGSIDKAAFNKNNVTFTSGKNTMTLQNVKGKKITFVDDEGNVTK